MLRDDIFACAIAADYERISPFGWPPDFDATGCGRFADDPSVENSAHRGAPAP